jgi:hypothetical protein
MTLTSAIGDALNARAAEIAMALLGEPNARFFPCRA